MPIDRSTVDEVFNTLRDIEKTIDKIGEVSTQDQKETPYSSAIRGNYLFVV
jgi:hypothetical protein